MIKKSLNINLASHPVRNRRLFFSLLAAGGILIIILVFFSSNIYLTYNQKNEGAQQALERLEERINQTQRKEEQISGRIEKIQAAFEDRLQTYNNLIFQKTFSWVELLTEMEKSLPNPCFIRSFSPLQKKADQLEVRFQVAYPSLEHLVDFIDNLNKLGFDNIQVRNETRSAEGYNVSEMSLRYERTH